MSGECVYCEKYSSNLTFIFPKVYVKKCILFCEKCYDKYGKRGIIPIELRGDIN